MLTIAHTMASNTGLAGILLAVYQHFWLPQWWACESKSVCEDVEEDRNEARQRDPRPAEGGANAQLCE